MKKIEELSLLYEISQALNTQLELRPSLYRGLEALSDKMAMVRGTISLLHPVSNEIQIEIAHGLTETARRRGRYQVGEGILGRVIQTGSGVTIPKISEEPLFLDRTATRKSHKNGEYSFISVPVKKGSKVIGALSVDRLYDPDYDLKGGKQLLAVVATMIATHVINLETIELEKERLQAENKRLQGELENK